MGKNGGIVKETLKLEIETELKNLDTSLNKMRDGFSKLNLGRSMEKEVAQMFSLVSEKIKALRANTKDGVINIADYKQVAKDIETITTKLRQMGVNVDLLGGTQRQLKEAVPLIDKMTQARQHYNNELNKTLKAEEKAKKQLLQRNKIRKIMKRIIYKVDS